MTCPQDQDEPFVAIARDLADAARAAIRPHFRSRLEVSSKAGPDGFDPVTIADRAAETAMRAHLDRVRPDDAILGEEFPARSGTSGYTWILDPIDGTRAFMAGLPVWTTLIGLAGPDGMPVVGCIDQPVLDERYLGWPGGAAMEQAGKSAPLAVSQCADLRGATIATTDPFLLSLSEQGAWTHLRHTARLVRYGLDAYGYARLAAGTIDLVAESGLQAWDTAALIPVVRGAGGLALDWHGNPARGGGQIVCATNDAVMDQALLALRRAAN